MKEDWLNIDSKHSTKHYLRDLWSYRELFVFLAWRDILVRYKQTIIGIAWSVLRPFLTMIVFTVVFGKLAKLPTQGAAPYAILVYCALLPWQFFSSALVESSNSLIVNAQMVSKTYFPRLIVPASSVMVCLVDFFISLCIMAGLCVWYKFLPPLSIVWIFAFMLIAFVAALGAGLLLSALNVKYRDFRYIIPFITQLGLYISPVGFSATVIPAKWQILYACNPMVGVIEGFRWAILGGTSFPWLQVQMSVVISLLIFILGFCFFRKTERFFADVI